MADIAFDDQVDITDKVCPLTFVKAKVAIEELDDGEVLAIRMNDFMSERLRTNHGSKNFKGGFR